MLGALSECEKLPGAADALCCCSGYCCWKLRLAGRDWLQLPAAGAHNPSLLAVQECLSAACPTQQPSPSPAGQVELKFEQVCWGRSKLTSSARRSLRNWRETERRDRKHEAVSHFSRFVSLTCFDFAGTTWKMNFYVSACASYSVYSLSEGVFVLFCFCFCTAATV